MDRFRVAAVQMSTGSDRAANLAAALHLVRSAAAQGAQLVVLPEVFTWRGTRTAEAAHHEPVPGPTVETMAALARELRIHLCMGSILEAIPGDARAYNTSCLLGPDGTVLAVYRKLHLFDVDLPGRVTVRESDARRPGNSVVVVPTAIGRVGLSICYDLRFPELYRRLADAGAEILVVPSAFTFPTGAAHWDVLCRARAIENQCYLVAANQTGESPHGFADWGDSLVADPWGRVLARAADGPGLALAEVDLGYLARVRAELPSLRHRRLG